MTAMSSSGNRLVQPFGRHRVAADAAETQPLRAASRLQRAHQLGPELVARFLAGDDPDRQGAVTSMGSAIQGSSTATRNRPRRSASASVFVLVEDEGGAGADGDARRARRAPPRHRPRADRRHVDAQVLAALRRLDEDAALAPLAAQPKQGLPHAPRPGRSIRSVPSALRPRARARARRPRPDRYRRRTASRRRSRPKRNGLASSSVGRRASPRHRAAGRRGPGASSCAPTTL